MIALQHATFVPTRRPTGAGLLATAERWLARRSQRRALLALDASRLKDIGLSAADAWAEGHKPFWRA
ncbi:MAG: DUF1127 domain-containing protein [Geminicoccaceae bacterium]